MKFRVTETKFGFLEIMLVFEEKTFKFFQNYENFGYKNLKLKYVPH